MNIGCEIPCHIKVILVGLAKKFKGANRRIGGASYYFLVNNTVLQVAGAVLSGNRRMALKMASMIWKINWKYFIQVYCISIAPRALLKVYKSNQKCELRRIFEVIICFK